MLDRRQEVRQALEALVEMDPHCDENRWLRGDIVSRFTRSYEILNQQLGRQPTFWSRLKIDSLFKRLSQKNKFHTRAWSRTRELARESLNEITNFELPNCPTFVVEDYPVVWLGLKRPDSEFYSEGVIERKEKPDDLVDYTPQGHFSLWWELRCDVLEVLEWYGLVLPEDISLDDQYAFYLTDDQLDTQMNVYVELHDTTFFSLSLVGHCRALLLKNCGWAINFTIDDNHSIYLASCRFGVIGPRFRECTTIAEVLAVLQVIVE